MRLPFRLPVASVVVLALAPCRAQTVEFDPRQHLEGFSDSERGAYSEVFDFTPFTREKGKAVSPARLDELRVLWRAESERGELRKRKVAQDPRQLALLKVEQKLRRDPYFRGLAWDVDDTKLPYAFLMQRGGDDERIARQTVNRVLSHLEAANQRIEVDVLKPAGVTTSETARLHTILVLAGRAHYDGCTRVHGSSGFYTLSACWVRAYDTLVLYRDPAWSPEQARSALRAAQVELGVARLHKATTAPAGLRAWWLLTGVAAYAGRAEVGAETPAPIYNGEWVKGLVTTLVDAKQRPYAATLTDLAVIPHLGYDEIAEHARERGALAAEADLAGNACRVFHQQAALWCSYLLTQRAPEFARCVRQALQGGTGVEALHAGFPPAELPAVETAFRAWLRAEHQKVAPTVAVVDPLPAPLVTPAGSVSGAGAENAAAPVNASAHPSPVPAGDTAAALALGPADWQLAFAAAMYDARGGALQRAAQAISAFASKVDDADAKARMQRTSTRLAVLIAVRKRALALHADGKKVLDLDFGGKRVRGRLEKLTDTHASVRAGKDLVEVELDTFEPSKLDIAARRLGILAGTAWESAYLQMLAEGSCDKVKRKLTATDAATQDLAGDLDSYATMAALSEPGRLLIELAQSDPPNGLDAVATLLRAHGTLPAVRARLEALRQRARALLAATFDPCTKEGLGVHAKVERVKDDVVRVTYSCKDTAELQDFTPDADCLKHWKFAGEGGGSPRIVSTGKAFATSGHGGLRLPFSIAAPLRAEWCLECSEGSVCQLGLCDNGRNSALLVTHMGSIFVDDPEGSEHRSTFVTYNRTRYTFAAKHDGKVLSASVDGTVTVPGAPVAGLTRGGVFLHCFGADPCLLRGLTLEWTLDPATVETLRQSFVARREGEIFGTAK